MAIITEPDVRLLVYATDAFPLLLVALLDWRRDHAMAASRQIGSPSSAAR
jgi:hypothetical protein